jgi:hypothetical protein
VSAFQAVRRWFDPSHPLQTVPCRDGRVGTSPTYDNRSGVPDVQPAQTLKSGPGDSGQIRIVIVSLSPRIRRRYERRVKVTGTKMQVRLLPWRPV